MDTGFMSKSIVSNHSLVGRRRETDHLREELADAKHLAQVELVLHGKPIPAHVKRSGNFFERCVTGAFADAVDSTFDLAGARFEGGQRISDSQTQIVVRMR